MTSENPKSLKKFFQIDKRPDRKSQTKPARKPGNKLIGKGGKPREQASSYRPICLLNIIGKLYEIMMRR
nr:unnamed protein product [Callosobruchus chinensis]